MAFDPQGPAPLLNRAWSRRGWASAPYFAKTVPGLMAETTVTFERQPISPNALGGWGPTPNTRPVDLWTTNAHVEHFMDEQPTLSPGDTVPIAGVTLYHHYEIYIDLPPDFDRANLPQKGDWVRFNDGTGDFHLPVMHVELNAGLLDHLEVWTDQVE